MSNEKYSGKSISYPEPQRNEKYLPEIGRTILHTMSTSELYLLDGECMKLQEKIKAELILRGDY